MEGWCAGMDEPYISDPRIERTLRAFAAKKIWLFSRFCDMDEESLYADLIGEVAKSKYHPEKSAPHTHAINVAKRRIIDILRRLKNRLASAPALPEDVLPQERAAESEDMGDELAEKVRRYYSLTLSVNIPPREGPGRPTLSPHQRIALAWLMKHMGWSCRDMERMCDRYPAILEAVGVTESRSYRFFARQNLAVTKLAKNLARQASPALVA